ncbi:coiled-coil domain-containing protein 40 [Trichomycterus rosablanca]|uniref:coiled-coil domain-containing protein 40 n=1 Tax=Trichomycterus rosablanca TaxID=2290929 RepID=UPI002F35E195
MERDEIREDEKRRDSTHEDQNPDEILEGGAEDPALVTVSQKEGSNGVTLEHRVESTDDVSHSNTTASVSDTTIITNTHSGQDSVSVPDAEPTSVELTMAYNSTVALTDGEGNESTIPPIVEEDNEEDEELIVLDPEHPLMKRLQSTLKAQLTKQLEKLDLELREKMMEDRVENTHREELGVALYSVQQELARLQAFLDGRHETTAKASVDRRQAQEQLEDTRNQYDKLKDQAKKHRTQVSDLQSEMDNLARRLLYMKEVTSDLQSNVSALKNATHKAKAEKRQAEEQKLQQDLYVERLTKQEEKLKEQISMYKVQTLAQTEETRAARDALAEAQMEMDSLIMERKQLLQQWNSSLVGMKRRDEAYTTLQEALRLANQEVRCLDGEVEGYRLSITREQEQNEKLTVLLNRAELNSDTYSKLITQSCTQQETLQALYSTHSRTLQETEKSLNRVTMECSARQSELTRLKKQLEKESSVRVELEEKIIKKMQEQLTHDSAAKHSQHLSEKTATHHRDRESQLSKLDNELATVLLEVSEVTLRCEALARLQLELEQEVTQRNQLLSANEAAAAKYILMIERNQATINLYNKKIEQIAASTGHEDLAPLEIQASNVNKQLEEFDAEIKKQQQFWLWQQEELVKLNQEKQVQSSALLTLNTQLTIMQQRKLRAQSEIDQEQRGLVELQRHSKALMLDMQKLNSLLNQNTQLKQELEQSNILMENNFIHALKDAERESVEMQLHFEKLQEEKERLLNSLVEAERQIMLWEKKTQLVRETRSAVDSEVGKGDICTMKAEIHRMEVHYAQLLKQQEKLLRDMETVIARRENIVTRGEAQARSDRKHTTHIDFQHTLQSLRRSILQTHKQAEECDGVITELQQKQSSLIDSLKEKQLQISNLHTTNTPLTSDLNSLQETREKNRTQLLALQSRVKQLQAVREGRYSPVTSEEPALELGMRKQQERLDSVTRVLQRVVQDFPQHESHLQRITQATFPYSNHERV